MMLLPANKLFNRFLILASLLGLSLICVADEKVSTESPFLDSSTINWRMNEFPIHRWKTLIGGGGGKNLKRSDILFGKWELAPHASYHGHKHEAPEIYYVISGKALWTVGEYTQEVSAGTTIYTKPNSVHRMINLGDEPVKAIWIWWAPNGDTQVFSGDYVFTEEPFEQPEDAVFKSDD